MGIHFPGSPDPTIGVEIELQTLDPQSWALVSGAPRILARELDETHIKKELLQCCLEVNTAVCRDVGEVESDLRRRIAQVLEAGDQEGLKLISAGTHPFSCWHEQEVTPDVRYHHQLERTQWTARRLLTFGLHVHVGVTTPEKVVAVYNAMTTYVPHLLALSASSPFWEGMDTGLDSARSKVFESLPGGGLPYRMRNWIEFQRMVRTLQKIGTISSIQELWGDIRPHSKYGTIEIRVCDAMPDLQEVLAVTALVQALVVWLGDLYDRGTFLPMPRYWLLQENKWRAVRWGMQCRLVVDENGGQQRFRHVMEDLIEALAPVSEALGSWRYLQTIQRMLEHGGSATRQRRVFQQTHSLEAVAASLEQELRQTTLDSPPEPAPEPDGHRVEPARFRNPMGQRARVWRDY